MRAPADMGNPVVPPQHEPPGQPPQPGLRAGPCPCAQLDGSNGRQGPSADDSPSESATAAPAGAHAGSIGKAVRAGGQLGPAVPPPVFGHDFGTSPGDLQDALAWEEDMGEPLLLPTAAPAWSRGPQRQDPPDGAWSVAEDMPEAAAIANGADWADSYTTPADDVGRSNDSGKAGHRLAVDSAGTSEGATSAGRSFSGARGRQGALPRVIPGAQPDGRSFGPAAERDIEQPAGPGLEPAPADGLSEQACKVNRLLELDRSISDTFLRMRSASAGDPRQSSSTSGLELDLLQQSRSQLGQGQTDQNLLLQDQVTLHEIDSPGCGIVQELEGELASSAHGTMAATTSTSALGPSHQPLGPDELSRHVEEVNMREEYVDTVADMETVLLNTPGFPVKAPSSLSRSSQRPGRRGQGLLTPSLSILTAALSRSTLDGELLQPSAGDTALRGKYWQGKAITAVDVEKCLLVKGGASLGDRAVGKRDHVEFVIRLSSTDGSEWTAQRRFRELLVLDSQLSQFAAGVGVLLPAAWERVRPEGRLLFGGSGQDVAQRRARLMADCLSATLACGPPLSSAPPLLSFLSPQSTEDRALHTAASSSSMSGSASSFDAELSVANSSSVEVDEDGGRGDGLKVGPGKMVRLEVEKRRRPSMAHQLQAQLPLEAAGLTKKLVALAGRRGSLSTFPRWCEYTGQLYCRSCHVDDVAILPALVLHHWDFKARPVALISKAYLDSIYVQPMLCVGAVNPYLYSRVPILAHMRTLRRRLARLQAGLLCSVGAKLQMVTGSRRYLLEDSDFYALRDLADLSRGAFAVLPGYLNGLVLKLQKHIQVECSVCRTGGQLCTAGASCCYANSLIFLFQKDDVELCSTCKRPAHAVCRRAVAGCPACTGEAAMPAPAGGAEQIGSLIASLASRIHSRTSSKGQAGKEADSQELLPETGACIVVE
eukprot:SM000188S03795  [mRNA]  locus=s188:48870:53201:+ [translate_table: standard]